MSDWPTTGVRPVLEPERRSRSAGGRGGGTIGDDLAVDLPGVPPDQRDVALARLVAAGATDVRVHLERTGRAVRSGDAGAAYGALVDLMIVLGPRARTVRERVLWSARDLLDPDDFERLRAHLDEGLHPDQPMPATPGSLLARGVEGDPCLVVPARPPVRRVRAVGVGGPRHDRYDPQQHLSGALEEVLQATAADGQARRVGGLWGSIVVLADETVRVAVDEAAFDETCRRPLALGEPVVGVLPGPTVDLREGRSWASLRAEVAARCSAGRPSVDVDPHRRYRLTGPVDLGPLLLPTAKRLQQALAEPSTQSELAWLVRDSGVVNQFLAAAHAAGVLEPVLGRPSRRGGRRRGDVAMAAGQPR